MKTGAWGSGGRVLSLYSDNRKSQGVLRELNGSGVIIRLPVRIGRAFWLTG